MSQQYQIFGPKYFFLKTKMKSYNNGNIIYICGNTTYFDTILSTLTQLYQKKSTLTQVVKIQETRQKIC
jgi:hypothetical protein